jgi:phage-related protein
MADGFLETTTDQWLRSIQTGGISGGIWDQIESSQNDPIDTSGFWQQLQCGALQQSLLALAVLGSILGPADKIQQLIRAALILQKLHHSTAHH